MFVNRRNSKVMEDSLDPQISLVIILFPSSFSFFFSLVGEVESAFKLDDREFQAKYGVSKPKVTDDNVVFLCKGGRRSSMARQHVEKLGYKKYVGYCIVFILLLISGYFRPILRSLV